MASVLILGATSEIGIGLARKFASEGFDLILAARRPEQLYAIESDIHIRYQVNCHVVAFNAMQYDTHVSFFESLPVKPEISICVFGVLEDEKKAFEQWSLTEQMINTNFTGAVSILNIIAKDYIFRKKGTIIGISSVSGDRGRASRLIYASSKAALSTYLDGLRNWAYPARVHVMTVKPGFVYTRMTENQPLPAALTSRPEEVARIIYNAYLKKKNVVYVKWFWRYIMLILRTVPEFQFKKMKM